MTLTILIIVCTLLLGFLGTVLDYSNKKYFDTPGKIFFITLTLLLIGFSIYGEYGSKKEKEALIEKEEIRFQKLSEKITNLESKKSEQENLIIAYQDSISKLYHKLDGTQGLLIKTLHTQRIISKEDEVLKFIQNEFYPLVSSLKIEYMKFITGTKSRDEVLRMFDTTMNIPEKAKILQRLSNNCETSIKAKIRDYFAKYPFLLNTGMLVEEFKQGKNDENKKRAAPKEYLTVSSDLNKLIEFMIDWKRNQ